MANYSTGVTFDCPCGATGVPVKWAAGDGFGMKARMHGAGLPFTQNYYRTGKCGGPTDLFMFMLTENEMCMLGRGLRFGTSAERAAGDIAFTLDGRRVEVEVIP